MAGTKISSFSSLDSGSLSANDTFLVVDVSDQLYSPNGTNKKTDLASILQSPLNPIKKNFLDLDDTPSGYGGVGQVLKVGPDGNSLIFSDDLIGSGSGISSGINLDTGNLVYKNDTGILSDVFNFSDLRDTPDSLSSGDGKFLFISGDSIQYKGIENITPVINFTDLQDTPNSLSGNEGKYLMVSGGQLEYADAVLNVDNSVTYDNRNIYVENSGAINFTGLLDTPNFYGEENEFLSFSGNNLIFKSLQTGNFLTEESLSGFNLNLLSGLEEYLTSGQIESSYLNKNATGSFLTIDSLSGYVEKNETGNFLTSFETGGFVTVDQTGDFLTNVDTFNFLLKDETGRFVDEEETGNLVTVDYLNSFLKVNTSGSATAISGSFNGSILGKDTFYGDGVSRNFFMSFAPENPYSIFVSLNGLIQSSESNYSLFDNNSGISFSEPIPSGMEIDIRHVGTVNGSSIKGYDFFSGDGNQTKFNLSYSSENAYSMMVSVGGLFQSSSNNYYLSDNNSSINFYEPVPSGMEIDIRHVAGPVMLGTTTNIVSTPSFISLTDTPSGINSDGEFLVTSGDRIVFSGLDVKTSLTKLEDTPDQIGSEGEVLVVSGGVFSYSGIDIKSNFLDLLDTPENYPQENALVLVNSSGLSYFTDFISKNETGNFLVGQSPTSDQQGLFLSVDNQGEFIYSEAQEVNDNSITYDYKNIYVENSGALEITGLNDTPNYLPQNNQILSYFNQKWEYKTLEDSAISKAWLSFKYDPSQSNNFDYESFNINSINRIDKGKYSISFTNTFETQDYCFNGNGYSSDDGWPVVPSKSSNQQNSNSTFYLSVKSGQELVDPTEDYIHLSFFSN